MTRGRPGPIVWPTEAGSSTSCSCPTAAPPWRSAGGWWAGATGRCPSPCARSSRGATRTRCTTRTRRSASRRSRRTRRWRGGPTTACRRCTRSPTAAIARSPSGTAGSSTRRSGRAGWTIPRTWRPRASSAGICPRPTPSCCSVPTGRSPATSTRSRASAATAARSARGARGSRPAWSARAMPTSSGAIRGRRSSPAIPGSPTGAATRSSPFEGSVSRPAGWTTRGRSCSSGRTTSPKGCCPTASSTKVMRPSTTRSMRRSGTSSPRTSISRPPKPRAARRSARDRRTLGLAVQDILAGHVRGTRYGIRVADDGLLAAGEPGVQLTWMDAKVGDWVVTPRIGKPVEIQALWLNALRIAERFTPSYAALSLKGVESFARRFWNAEAGRLYDVVDADHVPGRLDPSLRPNQILAVGGLPFSFLEGERARQVVDTVERHLWTPLGLRTLAPGAEGYTPRYQGGVRERDGAYHQGTVWPWLRGPVRGSLGESAWRRCGRAGRSAATVLPAAAGSSRRGRGGAHLGDRRRRAAAHPAGLSVSGVVGGRGAPARPAGPRRGGAPRGDKATACAARHPLSGRRRREPPLPRR